MRTERGTVATRRPISPTASTSSASMMIAPGSQWVRGYPAWSVAQTMKRTTAPSEGIVAGASRSDAVSFAVIARTIIPGVYDQAQLIGFYETAYSTTPAQAALYSRWRALGAVGKADHVVELCRGAGLQPASTLEIGCGDGALLSELHRRRFGGRLSGVEISEAAVAIARERPEIAAVQTYDGARLPFTSDTYEL